MNYVVIDSANELVSEETFASERMAYAAKQVYEDHCTDLARPLRVVRADTITPPVRAEGADHADECECEQCSL